MIAEVVEFKIVEVETVEVSFVFAESVAFVDAGTSIIIPGQTRTVQPKCPPGCPPSPNPYKLNQSKDK